MLCQLALSTVRSQYSEPSERSFCGKVTQLYEDHGLIDNHVYFCRHDVTTDRRLEVSMIYNSV